MRASLTDDNAVFADSDKSNVKIYFLTVTKLSKEKNLWLRSLTNSPGDIETLEELSRIYERNKKNGLYESVMHIIIQANKKTFEEEKILNKSIEQMLAEIIAEERMEDARDKGLAEGKAIGKAENILELLVDCGEVSEELRQRILSERNLDVLRKWIKLAAKAGSLEAFCQAM